ncbi:acetyl-CoA carboxylase biotin carboxyl carrier protein [Tautonia sociabilis]|uniref:Biotin carboxyl carrier protein of acetyl-CoA carboxylase n=1 Tax=Tautonia sociabilis TaxID=2080755 RepID=A0A432MD41_9BACT|nr:acetyl-CoA carboxylase biotin carboxyl carrier protein [Tautonia sociabilis]RUL81812.1 acetyl-CoA carboxylase biotin carboxyl carrier protein [Tautonia sociabilis]
MAESPTGPSGEQPDPDNVRRIHRLVRMMQQYDLTAIDLVEGPTTIRLRRRTEAALPGPSHAAPALPAPTQAAAPLPGPSAAAPSAAPTAPPPAPEVDGLLIESPMVGTYYQSSAPDAPPFVTVGATVRPETTVCIIEAMKVFTEIPAGVSGRIAEILVQDKQPVEFGQPLFRVVPS